MRKAVILLVTLALLAVISVAPAYAAAPQLPHAFCGNVLINIDPAPDGTLVSATVSSGTVITNIQNPVATVGGNYGIDGLPLLVQGDIPNGAIITFYVNGVEVEGVTATFEVGGGLTPLDLSVTIPATIGYSPSSFSFTATQGGANPPTQTLSISNNTDIDPTAMDWSVTSDATWLSLSPTSGSSSGEVDSVILSVSISGMSAGSYGGTITITAPTATNTPQTVAVSLTIAAPTPPPTGGGGPAPDTTAPTFSNILASSISDTSAIISWRTNEASTSQVEYWTSPSILSPLDETMVIDHHVQLTGLTPGTTYHYKTMSRDAAGNLAVSEEYTFTTLEAPAAPAAFSLSNLTAHPAQVQPGEAVTVAVHVANTGGTEGSYTVVLKINGVKEAEKSVTIAAGGSEIVTFSVTKEEAASYSVAVDGLSGSFTVVAPVVAPLPAAFSVSNLSIKPAEVLTGEAVTISVAVANTGGTEGSYTVVLKIDGVKEAEKSVTIAAGGSETVTFSVTKEDAASYSVTVDGLSGSFTVLAPAVVTNWPLLGGIIGAVIVIGLLVFFLVFRRRAY